MKKILQSNLGFGSAPLGNMYRDIPEDEAIATVNTAWDSGIVGYVILTLHQSTEQGCLRAVLVKRCLLRTVMNIY